MRSSLDKRFASHPMAFLSDVHGNLSALDAVLLELEQQRVSDVFVAGDLLLGGEDPLAVWRRLKHVGARCIRGLSDNALTAIDPQELRPLSDRERAMADRFRETRDKIGDLVLEELRRLPDRLRIPLIDGREVAMVHGSPADPTIEITHDMSDEEISALVADDPADIVICGASHVPFTRHLDGVTVANVGSVGASPDGLAHFAILDPRPEASAAGNDVALTNCAPSYDGRS
jgi:predicted phosphodiesterase